MLPKAFISSSRDNQPPTPKSPSQKFGVFQSAQKILKTSNVYLCVPKKTIGTLTSNMSNSPHISMSPKFLYKSCSIATSKSFKPFQQGNYRRIVAFAPSLWNVSVHRKIEFLYYSSTIGLLSLLIQVKPRYKDPSYNDILG
jgi:hypothetical protein